MNILSSTKERYGYMLHAYVLMDNHYHLLIDTPLANLHQIMQNINTSYTVFLNRRYQRSGHLFQGRYKAIVVDKENYLFGTESFVEKIKELIKDREPDRELSSLKKLSKEIPLEGVVKTVAEHYEVSMENLLRRSRRNGRERKIAIYFSKIMSKEKNSSIGKYFGIGPQAITNVLTDMESRIKESDDLKKEIDGLNV